MKLIANITTTPEDSIQITQGQEYEFASDEGGGVISEELMWGINDPCLALFTVRKPEAPVPALELCDELYRSYVSYALEDGNVQQLMGTRFKVLCWNPLPGEFRKDQIYEVEIMDEFGCGTDGFVSLDGYTVDTVEEALNHFVLVA